MTLTGLADTAASAAVSAARYAESDLGLPPLIDQNDFGTLGEWIDCLYWQYRAIVGDAGIRLWGKPIVARGEVCSDGRDKVFWHAITDAVGKRDRAGQRQLGLRRAARLGQAWHLLELLAAGDMRAVWWREYRPQGTRILVTTVNFRFVVVLQESRRHFSLVTVFPIGKRRRVLYMSRAAAAWESGACVVPAVKRQPAPAPHRSPDAIERHRCWL
jgi:hypothetical protein